MRVLITGASGFIGRHLASRIICDEDKEVFCLKRRTSRFNMASSSLKTIGADITQFDTLEKALQKSSPQIVYHCAGYVGENKDLLRRVNVEGTKNLLRACFQYKVEKVVYVSSIGVISGNLQIPLPEDMPFCATNVYGESKIEAEKIVWEYIRKGMDIIILRPCMVYGEDEPHMLGLILWLLKRRLYPIIGEGNWRWHLVYVENVVEALLRAETAKNPGPFTIADEKALLYRQVFEIMAEELKAKMPWHISKKSAYTVAGICEMLNKIGLKTPFSRARLEFITKDRVYSLEKAKTILGYKPFWSTEEALRQSVRGYLKKEKEKYAAS